MNNDEALISQNPTQRLFLIDGLTFAAQEWGREGQLPVLALHGWLDNSASFVPLAQMLTGVHLIAVDLAGHGKSSHRQGVAPYNIWEDVAEIFAIADQLGWQEFALLGHSRGGIIATLAAGTFPKRITHLALIEGVVPEPARAEFSPKQLALSIQGSKAQREKKLTLYPTLAVAIAVREKGMFPLSHAAARLLSERGLVEIDGSYCWSTDRRLLVPSAVKLLPEQIAAFISTIQAPIKLIVGADGMPKLYPNHNAYLAQFPQIDIVNLEGGHHLHLDDNVENVAETLNEFLRKK